MLRSLLPVMLGASLLCACAGRPKLESTPNLHVVADTELPAPKREDLVAPDRETYLGPLDELSVEVFGVDSLSKEVTVDASGRLSYPLVGTIDVNGKTTRELATAMQQALATRYIRDPQVTISVKSQVSQFVTVDGQVQKPGQVAVTNNSTLMRAVAQSGGVGEYAKLDDVVILRTVGTRRMAGLYNLGQIRRGVYADPAIYPNDIIIVGDSSSRRMFRDVLSIAPLLVAPVVALIQ